MEVNAILFLIFLILGTIFMIIEIVRAVWSWKKEKELIERERALYTRMKKVTINELRAQYGLPPMRLYKMNDPKDFEWPPVVKEESDEPNT